MYSLEASEPVIRIAIFAFVFLFFAVIEAWCPRRRRRHNRMARWPSNVAISALNQLLTRLIIPTTAVAVAIYCETANFGLFNQFSLPFWVEIALAILLLDLTLYLQHRAFHAIPIIWRLHRMHHADTDFDVTTGIRFHPASVILSAIIKIGVVFLLGPAAIAVLIFEVLLNATSLFNHSNLQLPQRIDQTLRYFVVTPDMHRVHHSSNPIETNSNFGFNFPWWDRFFGSYTDQPLLGHADMQVGLEEFRDDAQLTLAGMLSQPFQKPRNDKHD